MAWAGAKKQSGGKAFVRCGEALRLYFKWKWKNRRCSERESDMLGLTSSQECSSCLVDDHLEGGQCDHGDRLEPMIVNQMSCWRLGPECRH